MVIMMLCGQVTIMKYKIIRSNIEKAKFSITENNKVILPLLTYEQAIIILKSLSGANDEIKS